MIVAWVNLETVEQGTEEAVQRRIAEVVSHEAQKSLSKKVCFPKY